MLKNHEFDYFLYGLKSQTQSGLYEEIASKLSALCRMHEADLVRSIEDAKEMHRAGIGEGVAIIDVQSPTIKSAAMALCFLDHKIGFESPDGQASGHCGGCVIAAGRRAVAFTEIVIGDHLPA